jgi:hypothetical protein
MGVNWHGSDERVARNIRDYGGEVKWAVKQVGLAIAPMLEAYAKQNADWTDRTANARQSLAGYVHDKPPQDFGGLEYPTPDEIAKDIVMVYLSHGVEYGIYLETKYAGKYAVIWDSIEALIPTIRNMLQGIFK